MQKEATNRRPARPTGVNIFNGPALVAYIKKKYAKANPKKEGKVSLMSLVSAINRGYSGHTDGRSSTFKAHQRQERKLTARRKQRRLGR
jgi:hypothetical protein